MSSSDKHLDNELIDRLVSAQPAGETRDGQDGALDLARQHLTSCVECRKLVSTHEDSQRLLASLNQGAPAGIPPAGCPEGDVLYNLAGGLLDGAEVEDVLKHVLQCDHCSPVFRQAVADLQHAASPEETAFLRGLPSAQLKWQQDMARRLSSSRKPEAPVPSWRAIYPRAKLAVAASMVAVTIALFWFVPGFLKPRAAPAANELLARAYVEKRTVQMRMEGVPYAALLEEKDTGAAASEKRRKRPALLHAEDEVARKLIENPDDASWLQAQGRTELLEGEPDAAIAMLEKAHALKRESSSIAIDLASAYFERGIRPGKPDSSSGSGAGNIPSGAGDKAKAADILGRVLSSGPRNQAALFNHAIALQSLGLYQQAESDWQLFLSLFPASEWAGEARERLGSLQQEMNPQKRRGAARLKGPEELVAAVEGGREDEIAAIDRRVEQYLPVVVKDWLPGAFVDQRGRSEKSELFFRGLTDLAGILEIGHEDNWLESFLKADRNSKDVQEAVRLLAEAERAIEVSDGELAKKRAEKASILFRASGVLAGEAYAEFQIIYVNQLSHQSQKCAEGASRLWRRQGIKPFAWLAVQTSLESAICASTSDDRAVEIAKKALGMAGRHSYPGLRSRSTKTLSGIEWAVGDSEHAWNIATKGLRDYWSSELPPVRGYSFLTDLDVLAEDNQQWFLQTAVLKEAVPMISNDADPVVQAFEKGRLGRALLRTGDFNAAEMSFREMARLFEASPPSQRSQNVTAEAVIGLAAVDLERGNSEKAVTRLRDLNNVVSSAGDDDLALEFYTTYGRALAQTKEKGYAETNLKSALRLAVHGLALVRDERARLRWARRNEPAYRAMVEIKLGTAPGEALSYWESYKGASLQENSKGSEMNASTIALSRSQIVRNLVADDTALVSYFFFEEGLAVWVVDSQGTQLRLLNLRNHELEKLIREFTGRCADSSSSLEVLHREGREIYEKIFLSIEPLVKKHHRLLVEPDGGLRYLPFAALVDSNGTYLGDRYAIAISPGISYEFGARPWHGISPAAKALVVDGSVAPGVTPLPDSEKEARQVAALFQDARLLLGNEANYANVAGVLPVSEVFHFSGHAFADRSSAGVLLGSSGLVDAAKLEKIRIGDSQLVVLSACGSAAGTTGLFDDEDSLVRIFIRNGVPEVVASRWALDAGTTAELMTDFYRHVLAGSRVSESLSAAAVSVRSKEQYRHPYYWAGLAVFGRG